MIRRAWCALLALVLRWQIWEPEHYLADCERDGLTSSLMMTEWRGQLAALRVQLASLQPPRADVSTQPRADGAPQPAEACTELGSDSIIVHLPRPALLYAAALVVLAAGTAVLA